MPAIIGRKIILTWGAANVGGVREKSAALNGELINVSDDDSAGWREILVDPGENTVDISISGVTKDDVLKADWFGNTRTKPVVITYPDGGVISGDFSLASYTDNGPYNDATTFDAELQSTGIITYTPGP